MPLSSIGDMRQQFLNMRSNSSLRQELNTLVAELTSGQSSDLTQHLGAGQTELAGIDRQLDLLDSYALTNTETGQFLTMVQTSLSNVDSQREKVASALLFISPGSTSDQIVEAGTNAQAGLEGAMQSLNMRFGGGAMFGGRDIDTNPLVDAATILSEIETLVSGLTNATDIANTIDDWFDQPGGGFETLGYQGDSAGHISRTLETNLSLDLDVRADDQAFRDIFKAFSKAIVAGDLSNAMDLDDRRALQKQSGVDLTAAASPLTNVRGRIGLAESRVEEAATRVAAQQTSYVIARNEMVSVDPFETASRLEAVQLQLETHYTLTARLSRLSLTEYLR